MTELGFKSSCFGICAQPNGSILYNGLSDYAIFRFKDGERSTAFGGKGFGNALDQLDCPWGLAIEADTIYVADSDNGRILALEDETVRIVIDTFEDVKIKLVRGIAIKGKTMYAQIRTDVWKLVRFELEGETNAKEINLKHKIEDPFSLCTTVDGCGLIITEYDSGRVSMIVIPE